MWPARIRFHLGRCPLNLLLKSYQPPSASRSRRGACFMLLLALLGAVCAAQTLKTSGTLEGTISDSSSKRIAGVKVTFRQTETNQTRTVTADDQGSSGQATFLWAPMRFA
jgi:hypothetical protein